MAAAPPLGSRGARSRSRSRSSLCLFLAPAALLGGPKRARQLPEASQIPKLAGTVSHPEVTLSRAARCRSVTTYEGWLSVSEASKE